LIHFYKSIFKMLADRVKQVILNTPVFPYLWIPHCILMCCALRMTLGKDKWRTFSRKHPLSCFLLGLIYIYPGGMLASLISGNSLLSFMKLTPNLYGACATWYLMFYCPADALHRLLTGLNVLPMLTMLQDWQRVGLVLNGVQAINNESPGYFLYPVFFGVIKSSGFMFIKYVEVGIMQGLTTGFRVPNQATKTMIIAAVLLQLQELYSVFPTTTSDLYCYLVIFALFMRFVSIILTQADWDPYLTLEKGLCDLLCGSDPDDSQPPQQINVKQKTKKKD